MTPPITQISRRSALHLDVHWLWMVGMSGKPRSLSYAPSFTGTLMQNSGNLPP